MAKKKIEQDLLYMQKALALARKGLGHTSPNPTVGAVVVRAGKVVSQAFHTQAGLPHAERIAIDRAGRKARGADLYVTLEPCSSWGRTPPCTNAIIDAGIRRVILAVRDPNPANHAGGIRAMKAKGIRISEGVLKDEASLINESFFKFVQTQRPFVFVKAAQSLDGRLATHTGDSRWISNRAARQYAHVLRSQADAVLVGVSTVIRDNPRLNVRLPDKNGQVHQPKRIVLDSTLRIPLTAKIVKGALAKNTIIATTKEAQFDKARVLMKRGVKLLTIDAEKGKVALKPLFGVLGALGYTSIMVEGGSEVITSILEQRLADKMVLIFAPKLIGGSGAPSLMGGKGVHRVDKAITLTRVQHRTIGSDLVVEGYPAYPPSQKARALSRDRLRRMPFSRLAKAGLHV